MCDFFCCCCFFTITQLFHCKSVKFATNCLNIYFFCGCNFFKYATFLHKFIINLQKIKNLWFFASNCWLFQLNCIEFSVKIQILRKLLFLIVSKKLFCIKIPHLQNFRLSLLNIFTLITKKARKALNKTIFYKSTKNFHAWIVYWKEREKKRNS